MVNATMGAPMTRAEALQWCVERLSGWPQYETHGVTGGEPLPIPPAGWVWVLSGSDNWYLKNTEKHGEAILGMHYKDACYLRDQNDIGKAVDVTICGVPARIGHRYKFNTGTTSNTVGTLAGVMGGRVWFVDCLPAPDNRVVEIDHITGLAHLTERDEFVERATSVMSEGNPSVSVHVARLNAGSMWNAGARFTDPDEE